MLALRNSKHWNRETPYSSRQTYAHTKIGAVKYRLLLLFIRVEHVLHLVESSANLCVCAMPTGDICFFLLITKNWRTKTYRLPVANATNRRNEQKGFFFWIKWSFVGKSFHIYWKWFAEREYAILVRRYSFEW